MATDTVNQFACHTIFGKIVVQGEALISPEAICFYMIDGETGVINESGHALEGRSIKDKVLIIPNGKGSSVVQDEGLYALRKHNTGPVAIIVKEPDTILVAGAIVMEFPLIDGLDTHFFESVTDGVNIRIDCQQERIFLTVPNLH